MRVVYWIDERLHAASVSIGNWALRKWYRPLVVALITFTVVNGVALLLLKLMEEAFRS